MVLPFHFPVCSPLAFVAFIPYWFVVDGKSSGDAFTWSFLFGFVFYILLGFWLTLVNILGFVLLAGYLALYFSFFGLASAAFLNPKAELASTRRRRSLRALFFIPAFWVVLEYIRGWLISGIPWALLAYSQWRNLPIIQIADLVGAWGVSYFVLFVNLALYKIIEELRSKRGGFQERRKSLRVFGGVLSAVVLAVVAYGWLRLAQAEAFSHADLSRLALRVSLIQGNIPQDRKWNEKIKNIIFEKYRRLTLMSASEKAGLIVWPETSFPGYLEDEPFMASQLRSLVRQTGTHVLVGAPTLGNLEREGLRFYNSAVLYGPDGEERKRHNKLHLVPFGEYIPLEPVLGFIRRFVTIGRFSPGTEKKIFEVPLGGEKSKARFGVLICYEDIFPSLVRGFCRKGADFMINITNDAWFGRTTAPYQHAQASVFRAVENRIPIVRSTNTGFSCFITAEGRIVERVEDRGNEIFITGHKTHDILLRNHFSFYSRFGDLFVFFSLFLCFLAWRNKAKQENYSRL